MVSFPFIFSQPNLKGNHMIFYFTGALLISFAIFRLGFYAAIIGIISTGAKVTVALLLIAALILLYKRFRRRTKQIKLLSISDK